MTEATQQQDHSSQETFEVTKLNKVRNAKRASYDVETVHSILDEGLIAHVAFLHDENPILLPMAYGRIGSRIYIHGAKGTRLFKQLKKGLPACINVTLLDGLVVARSAFHHSMNFRSVNIHGTAILVEDEQEKYDALVAITDHLAPGRWDECRDMTPKEANATTVIALDIETAAAKCRAGMPVDDEEDYDLDHWAGIVPITTAYAPPVNDHRLKDGINVPPSVKKLTSRN